MDQEKPKHKTLLCRFCGVTFRSHQTLGKHVKRHKKGLSCSICLRPFDKKYTLIMHEKKYANEVPFECDTCNTKFHIESRRDAHMLTHSEENPFLCKICGKHFTHKHALSRHRETHVGQKLFKCKVCKKPFSQKGNLKRHVLTHVGAKPFSCEVCGKEFSQRGHLNMHRLIHDGRKPFACDICGDQFSTRCALREHCNVSKDNSGCSKVEVLKFYHKSMGCKSKSITISVGDKILGCIDIECRMEPSSNSASNKRSSERHRTNKQPFEEIFLEADSNGIADESCRTRTKLSFSKSDFSDFALKGSPRKSYQKSTKAFHPKIDSPHSASTEGTDKVCSAATSELYFPDGKVQNFFNLNKEAHSKIFETSVTKFEGQTSHSIKPRNEAPPESYKASISEFLPADGKALHFIKLTSEELHNTYEANSTEFCISEGKAQHFIKLTNEAEDETCEAKSTVLPC